MAKRMMRKLVELVCFVLILPFVAAGFVCAYLCAAWQIGVAEADRFGNRELDRIERGRRTSAPTERPRIYRP